MRLGAFAGVTLAARVAAADPPKPAAHYAKLFTQGAAWTYDVSLTTWDGDKIAAMEAEGIDTLKMPSSKYPRKTTTEQLRCNVVKVAKLRTATVSEVACDKDFAPYVRFAGVYLASARGLFELGEFPASESDVPTDLDEPLIAAAPKVSRKVTPVEIAGRVDGKTVARVRRRGGAWCTSMEMVGGSIGHDGIEERCFAGVVASGTYDFGPELQRWKYRVR